MGNWKIVTPSAGYNYCTNPSFEKGTTGWTSAGTLSQTTARRTKGQAALNISPNGTNLATYAITFPSAGDYIVSGWVKHDQLVNNATGIKFESVDFTGAVDTVGQTVTLTYPLAGDSEWVRVYTRVSVGPGDLVGSFRLAATGGTPTSGSIWLDGVQIELAIGTAHVVPSTYIDGDQLGCSWVGEQHGSKSYRKATRDGGLVKDLADDFGFYVRRGVGLGSPEVDHLVQDRALVSGAQYQGHRLALSELVLQGIVYGEDVADYRAKRQALMAAVSPAMAGGGPVIIRYTGADLEKDIRAVYRAGLEGQQGDGNQERLDLRLVAYDTPYWEPELDQAVALDLNDSLTHYGVLRKLDGVWDAADIGSVATFSGVDFITVSHDKRAIWVGGNFTDLDGVTAADHVASYNPDTGTWTGYAGAVSTVLGIAIHPTTGYPWIVGSFLAASGDGDADYIAQWTGSVWDNVGLPNSGGAAIGLVTSCLFDQSGNFWVAGSFTDLAGVANADYIAYWNGSAWQAAGTGANGVVNQIKLGPDGLLYAVGSFTTIGGTSANRVARWTGSAWEALGGGLGASPICMAFAENGDLYVGGSFTTLGDGSTSCKKIAKWNGSAWSQVGSGLDNGQVNQLGWLDNELIVVGDFTAGGGLSSVRFGLVWNGSSWSRLDILPSTGTFTSIDSLAIVGDQLWIGGSHTGTAQIAGSATATNGGTAPAWPAIKIARSGGTSAKLIRLENVTTGATIYLEYDLADGEEVTLDLRPGRLYMSSSFYGPMWRIMAGSQIADFKLRPGANEIVAYAELAGSPTMTGVMFWTDTYMGAD